MIKYSVSKENDFKEGKSMKEWKIEVERWIKNVSLDENLKRELDLLLEDEEKNCDILEESFFKELEFGTGGLRSILGAGTNRLNVHTIRKATQGIADYIKENTPDNTRVAIGYDSRINSRLFAEETANVLIANGVDVYMFNEVYPVPALVYALLHYKCEIGIMITASHNPSKYNGYKVYEKHGYQVTNEQAEAILEAMNKVDIFDGPKYTSFDETEKSKKFNYVEDRVKELYINRVLEEGYFWTEDKTSIKKAMENLKVIYTPLNGAGNKPVREVMNRLGINHIFVVKEQELPDGNFPTCPYPNPEKREALELGIKLIEKEQGDILIGTDPDCDRMGMVCKTRDGKYRIFTGNETALLFLDYIIRNRKRSGNMPKDPVIVRTIVSSKVADKIAEKNGINVKTTLTGFKYIGEYIQELSEEGREENYIFGFEESYGYLSGTYVRDKDGVNAALLACLIAAEAKLEGKYLDEKLEDIYKEHGYVINNLMDFTFEGMVGMNKISNIMENFRNNVPKTIIGKKIEKVIDYKKDETGLPKSNVLEYILEGGTGFLIRPSGTEPKIKVYTYAVGETKEEATEINAKLKAELNLEEK